ncbi:hypothetical protein EDD18DRAFT_1194602 [Armillaria luteobubalina]|uniref:Uncharacterized protein n=1 Tax=Armillaria luteobubalina TaxID=153913 RepID=A0AA39PLP5_9AGAR|nr:hypothetical protein EDD18DRAFT_1194602 [Armillaria luteobubalina]
MVAGSANLITPITFILSSSTAVGTLEGPCLSFPCSIARMDYGLTVPIRSRLNAHFFLPDLIHWQAARSKAI